MRLIIENLQNKRPWNDNLTRILEEAVILCLNEVAFEFPSEINLFLVDDDYIREINREQRGIDRPTDVLSFPMFEMDHAGFTPNEWDYDLEQNLLPLGDIVISLETAERQADEYGHTFERELAFLFTHGVYHLLGFDHENIEDEQEMLSYQESVLAKLNLVR